MVKKKEVIVKKFRKKNSNKLKAFMEYLLQIMKWMFLKSKLITVSWIILILGVAVFPSINIILSKLSIDYINNIQQDPSFLKKSFVILFLIVISNVAFTIISSITTILYAKIKQKVDFYVQKLLYEKLNIIEITKFEENDFYTKLSLAQEAIYRNCLDIINYFFNVIQDLLVIIGVLLILVSVHWSLPIALILSTVPGVISIVLGKTMRFKMKWDNSEKNRQMSYITSIFFNRITIKEVRLFGIGEYLIDKWSNLYAIINRENIKIVSKEEKMKLIGITVLQFSSFLISCYLISLIASNQITLGVYVSLATAITTIQGSLSSIWGHIGEIFEIHLSTQELLDIINNNGDEGLRDKTKLQEISKIGLFDLSFRYPNDDKYTLKDINLEIKKGEKIAIVGDNGAGKSTLVNILLGLYQEYEGEVLVNDIELKKIDIKSYNNLFSAILQNFVHYNFTVKENIAFGNIEKIHNNDLIYEALKEVDLYDKICTFKNGIDTILGKEYEDGEELSGGQWQKLAIARAILRSSEFVVLDEPTSALDPISELEIFRLFNRLFHDKTTITISHRLGITRYVAKIIVMSKGEIAEVGSHDELISLGQIYYKMYNSQANWYQQEGEVL